MLDKLSTSFLEATLPILEQALHEQYERMTQIFREMITSKEENKAFFLPSFSQ